MPPRRGWGMVPGLVATTISLLTELRPHPRHRCVSLRARCFGTGHVAPARAERRALPPSESVFIRVHLWWMMRAESECGVPWSREFSSADWKFLPRWLGSR